jgi:hypothetical protein
VIFNMASTEVSRGCSPIAAACAKDGPIDCGGDGTMRSFFMVASSALIVLRLTTDTGPGASATASSTKLSLPFPALMGRRLTPLFRPILEG